MEIKFLNISFLNNDKRLALFACDKSSPCWGDIQRTVKLNVTMLDMIDARQISVEINTI